MTGDVPAPTVPDEAVEAAARELAYAGHSRAFDADRMGAPTYEQVRTAYRDESRAALTAAAPFIVAASQPDAAEVERLRAQREAALALAETWRYKGEFGWGAWQEGHGPDQEGWILDAAATAIRRELGITDTP